MKLLFGVLSIVLLCLSSGHLLSAAAGAGELDAVFLDLPEGFGSTEEEEDLPEIIEFYSQEYEGDAFFFVLDASKSMRRNAASGQVKFQILKREVVSALSGLTKRSVLSCVFYNSRQNQTFVGDPPLKMDDAGKSQVIAKLFSTSLELQSCMALGADKAFEVAQKTKNEHRTMIIVADGRTQCRSDENNPDRVFARIMARNQYRIPINTIYVGPQSGKDWSLGKPLLERLSRATNGKFTIGQ
jgi:hypothetical protein